MINSPISTSALNLKCHRCGKEIKFDDKRVGHKTGKKIPLDLSGEPHHCVQHDYQRQEQRPPEQRKYFQCSKGCNAEIYFDVNQRTAKGGWIPISKATGLPHHCQSQL